MCNRQSDRRARTASQCSLARSVYERGRFLGELDATIVEGLPLSRSLVLALRAATHRCHGTDCLAVELKPQINQAG